MRKLLTYTYEQEREDILKNARLMFQLKVGGVVLFIIVSMLLIKGCACASEEITEDKAILAVIGEAENQSYEGMLAVSCAIRNRGTLQGVYGLNAPRVRKGLYTKGTWLLARKAWKDSAKATDTTRADFGSIPDLSLGGNSWENTTAFGKPTWASSCEETVTIKDHVFFKCPTPKRRG